jgi:cytoskeletal protein RodZ
MQSFGQYLKSEREKRGIRLEEIASSTKIHVQNLSLMEEDRWKELPQEPFIRGFISAYAKYLGLDNKETLKKFSESQNSPESISQENLEASAFEVTTSKETEIPAPPKKLSSELKKLNLNSSVQVKAVLVAAILLVVTLVVLSQRSEQSPTAEVTPANPGQTTLVTETTLSSPAVDTTQTTLKTEVAPTTTIPTEPNPVAPAVAVAPTPTTVISVSPTPQKPPTVIETPTTQPPVTETKKETAPIEGHELQVTVKYRTWMKVVIDDSPATETYLEAGSKTSYQAQNKIKLVLGNSTGSEVVHNGEVEPGKKYSGTIRFYIFPRGSRFPQDKPKAKKSEDSASGDEETIPTTQENVD